MRGIAVLAAIAALLLRDLIVKKEYDFKTVRLIIMGFLVFFGVVTLIAAKITGTF